MFNSLKYAKKLEEVGLSREQAEAHVQMIVEIMETNLATKQDMKDFQTATQEDIKDLRLATQEDIKDLRLATQEDIKNLRLEMDTLRLNMNQGFKDLRQEMVHLEYRLTVKLGTIVSIAVGVALTLSKLF